MDSEHNISSSPAQDVRARKRAFGWVIGAVGVLGAIGLVAGAMERGRLAGYERRLHSLAQEVSRVRALEDDEMAATRLLQLRGSARDVHGLAPAVEYDLLYRRWRLVTRHFDTLRAASKNRYLAAGAREMARGVQDLLYQIHDGSSEAVQGATSQDLDTLWRLYNLRGCVSVLLAYSVLEFEKDGKKSLKFLGDALEDYKRAISLVDDASTSSFERSLPRWNLELIAGRGEYRRIGLGDPRQENLAEVRDQLEAVIPDMGGFAPGVPLDTAIEK